MKLDQFKFKESKAIGVKEEAKLQISKNSTVEILKKIKTTVVKKTVNGEVVYNVPFLNNVEGQEKLAKALKNIGKRK